jgi:hypothetical protein
VDNLPPRRLPVSQTFVRAYHLVWFHRYMLLRTGSIPLLMLCIACGLYTRLVSGAETPEALKAAIDRAPKGVMVTIGCAEFLGVWTLCAFNVSWRRYLLHIGERVDALYFRKPLWRYVFSMFVASLVFFASMFIALELIGRIASRLAPSVSAASSTATNTVTGLILLLMIALLGVLIRHTLIFTQVITDEPEASFKPLRRAMRGNVLRLLMVWTLTLFTAIGVPQMILFLIQLFHIPTGSPVLTLVIAVMVSFTTVTLVALMSAVAALAYDFLVRGGGPAEMN